MDEHLLSTPVESRRVLMRTIEESDVPALYEMATNPSLSWMQRFRGTTPSPEEFQELLWRGGSFVQFVLESKASGRIVGHVAAYDAQPSNGHCQASVFGVGPLIGSGVVVEGFVSFLDYLFYTWPFRKIYAEAADPSYLQFSSGVGRYFEEEGVLKEHAFMQNRFVDVRVLAIYRTRWTELAGRRRSDSFGDSLATEAISGRAIILELLESLELARDNVSWTGGLTEWGLDSLALLELAEGLASYGIDLPDELLASIQTLEDLVYYSELHFERIRTTSQDVG